MDDLIRDLSAQEYKDGFVTEVAQEYVPKGLNEDIIRLISAKKGEPDWLLEFRLGAFRKWRQMTPPQWGHLKLPPIDFQDIIYWAAPKRDEDRPDEIDPAILRTGRIDKQVFVPLPDFEARKAMFQMYIAKRPTTEDLNIDEYAQKTEGYIASDIAFIVNDAAMTAAFTRQPISHALMNTSISNIKPSLQKEVIEEYSQIRNKMNGVQRRAIVQSL